jgi:DNA-binding transcriptional MerR regulator
MAMANDTWTSDELFEGLDPAPDFVAELELLGLLVVVGRDGQRRPLYSAEARDELEKVLDLIDLGYQPEDIAAIARKVGLPAKRRSRFRKAPVHLRATEIAERSGLAPDLLARWVTQGLVAPSLRSEGGEPLFPAAAVTRVGYLRDLFELGVDEGELAAWSRALDWLDTRRPSGEMTSDQAQEAERLLGALKDRLVVLGDATRRWARLTATFRRRLAKLRPSAAGGKRGRRRLKTRTRP